MCTRPKRLLLTPDIWRMCLLQSLVFLCRFSFFTLFATVNLFAIFNCVCVWRIGASMQFYGDGFLTVISMFLGPSTGVSMITHNCQAPRPTPCFMLRGLSSGQGIWLRQWYFTCTSVQKECRIYPKRLQTHWQNQFVCLQKTCCWNAKCFFFYYFTPITSSSSSSSPLVQILSDTETLIWRSLFTTSILQQIIKTSRED